MPSNPSLIRGIGFGLACCVSVVAAIHFVNLTMDDAFISFRYSENLAAGQGLVFNLGERVEGYTNFLWTVLMAIPALLGAGKHDLGMLIIGKALSWAFSLGSLAVVCWDRAPTFQRSFASLPVGALFLATTAPALVWSVGALEGPMVGFLIALSVRHWTAEMNSGVQHRPPYWSALFLALAALTRPEPVLLIVPLFVLRVATGPQALRASWRGHLRYLLMFAIPIGAFLSWRWFYYGDLLPNTYYAKRHGDDSAIEWGIRYLSEGFEQIGFVPIAVVSCVAAVLARGERRRVALLLCMITIQLAGVAYEGGDWMPALRLVVPTLPLVALLINSAWRGAANFEVSQLQLPVLPSWVVTAELREQYNGWISVVSQRAGARLDTLARWVMLASLSATIVMGANRTVNDWARREGSGFSAIHMDRGLHFQVARWMNQHIAEPGVLATGEIGVVPYYTKLPVLDLFGLTDVHIAHRKGTRHAKFDLQYVLGRAPKFIYLLMRPTEPGKPRRAQQNHGRLLLESLEFQQHYSVLQDFGEGLLYQRRP